MVKDIKNRKATINGNEYVTEVARKNDKLISVYVQIELKEGTTKIVRYIDFDNINIKKYVE